MSAAVAVVIPTYNRAADLTRALESLRGQTVADWEAIVVDNHSADGTRAMVEGLRDSRIRFLEVHNQGIVAYSRNVGIRAATAEYVALLDSDDWWQPRKLEESLRRLRAGADVVYHDLYLVGTARQRFFWRRARTRPLKPPVFRDLLENGNAVVNSSVVIRRELLTRTGGFSEEPDLVGWEDYDLWIRIARLTERFERIERPLGYYWSGGGNLSTPRRLLDNLAAFRERYVGGADAPLEQLPGWVHYAAGMAHFASGEFAAVPGYMSLAIGAGLPPSRVLKASLLRLVSRLRGGRRRSAE